MTADSLELRPVGAVEPLSFDGETFTVRSPRPLPPGTRVTLAEGETSDVLAQGKITSVDRRDAETGSCDLRVRLFCPERSARERLEAIAAYQKKEPPR